MKQIIFTSLLICASIVAHSQLTPMFETKMYVKDALGNIDSVEFGYDSLKVTFDTSLFHEVIDMSPFDTILDMRVVKTNGFLGVWAGGGPNGGPHLYKRYIGGTETTVNAPCTLGGPIIFMIRAKHQPITLFWNSADFSNPVTCRLNSFLSPDAEYMYANPAGVIAAGGSIYACARKTDSLTFIQTVGLYQPPTYIYTFSGLWPVEGVGLDTVSGVMLNYSSSAYYSPCRIVVDTEEPVLSGIEAPFALQPNPGSMYFEVINERNAPVQNITLMDTQGRILRSQNSPEHMSTDGLPPGIYLVAVTWADGRRGFKKWVAGR